MRKWTPAIAAAILLFALVPPALALDESITLRFAYTQSVNHPVSVEGAKFFSERVRELSNGAITIQEFPAAQLGSPRDTLEILARGGIADIPFIGPSWYPGQLPLATVADIPGLYIDSAPASRALWTVISGTIYEKELKQRGIRPLVAVLTPTYQIFSVQPFPKDLTQLRGLKLRSPGGTFEYAAVALGATPVSMPANDAYEALSRGVLDATFADFIVAEGQRFEEATNWATYGAPFGSFTNIYAINQQVWDQLPDKAREILVEAGMKTMDNMNRALNEREVSLAKRWSSEGKVEVRYLTPTEQKSLLDRLRPVQEQWVADMERRGLPGSEILNEFRKALETELSENQRK